MEILNIEPTNLSPAIRFIPELNDFSITGMSAPEDVRSLYYPVIEWIDKFNGELIRGEYKIFSETNPLTLKIDLRYFNSASAKFLLDILLELKKIRESGPPFVVEWYYEEDDIDMKEAGEDISELVEMELKYIIKPA